MLACTLVFYRGQILSGKRQIQTVKKLSALSPPKQVYDVTAPLMPWALCHCGNVTILEGGEFGGMFLKQNQLNRLPMVQFECPRY